MVYRKSSTDSTRFCRFINVSVVGVCISMRSSSRWQKNTAKAKSTRLPIQLSQSIANPKRRYDFVSGGKRRVPYLG